MTDQDVTKEKPKTAQAVVDTGAKSNGQAKETKKTDVEAPGEDRGKSTVRFPYIDMDSAMTLPTAIYKDHGLRCTPDQLAAASSHENVRSGAFIRKVAAAQTFNFIARDGDDFVLTEIGKMVVREDSKATGKAKSFLSVELYKKMFDEFKGGSLPQDSGIESTMIRFGVAPKQAEIARQVFKRSAEQAGFCAYGKDRLVAPPALTNPGAASSNGDKKREEEGGGGGGDDMAMLKAELENAQAEIRRLQSGPGSSLAAPTNLPASIKGFLMSLPLQDGQVWTKEEKDTWMKTFDTLVTFEFRSKIEAPK